jgi:hypothetical protein
MWFICIICYFCLSCLGSRCVICFFCLSCRSFCRLYTWFFSGRNCFIWIRWS